MSIFAYNRALDSFSEISNPISVQFLEYYNGIGKMSINLVLDDYNISAIENGGVIYDTDLDISFTIQSHQYDTQGNKLVVNGYTCNWLLDRRVLANKKYFSNVEEDVYEAVIENLRELPFVEISTAQGFTETTDSVVFGGQVLTKIMPVLESAKIGQRMDWDPDRRVHIFRQYKGRDLTTGIHAVVFSEDQGTAPGLIITKDASVFSNHIFVQGKLSDETEIVVEVGSAPNSEKSEFWLRNTYNQESNESESDFRGRLNDAGKEEIAARISRTTFSVQIPTDEYGLVYKLGDVVSAAAPRFGVELKCRITGVKYTMDTNGSKIELILGEPVLTVLGEELLKYGRNT